MNTEIIILNGKNLTVDKVIMIAKEGARVDICHDALDKAKKSREIVFDLINSEKQIYGLNTGVGANKDNKISADEFKDFNERLLYSHTIGLPPYADKVWVRATLVCRLNGLLNGVAGVQINIILMLRDFLNLGIHPRIPQRGSVGMSDLGNMAFIGLAMIGKGEVEYKNQYINAKEALSINNLNPIVLGPKDALPIVSSNAFSVAKATLLFGELEKIIKLAELVYSMGFEAQSYNTMFIDKRASNEFSFVGQCESLDFVHKCLEGSHIWMHKNENISGTLSYKSSCAISGAIRDSFNYIASILPKYLNYSDDCPMVLIDEKDIISTDNFIITGLAIAFEMADISLAHLSSLICNRILRLGNDRFSNLPRFLRAKENNIAFSTIQKTVVSINNEIRHLSNSATLDYVPTANETEDHGCMTPYILSKTEKIIDLMYYLIGIEAMHCAQAADLSGNILSGKGTSYAYRMIRNKIEFLSEDNRDLSKEMIKAYELVKNYEIIMPEIEEEV